MKYLNQSILIITITALFICNNILGQTKPTQTTQPTPTNGKEKDFDTKPFDLKQEKLPPNYKGHNPELLFNILFDSSIYKDDYEKLDEFRRRIQDGKQKLTAEFSKRMGEFTLNSIFAFQVEIFPEYDANTKAVKASFDSGTSWFNERIGYLYSNKEKTLRTYTGQNAYGAQVTVKVVESESLQILAANGERFLFPSPASYEKRIGAKFDMDAETVSSVKTKLKALLICKLIEPYSKYKEDILAPTLSNPEQTELKAKALVTEILEIWYYDTATGTIYFKQKMN